MSARIASNGTHRLRLVEVAGKADFVAYLHAGGLVPGVGRVWQYLAAQKALNAALVQQWYLLGVAQIGVRLVLDDGRLAADIRLEQSFKGVRLGAASVNLLDERRRVF